MKPNRALRRVRRRGFSLIATLSMMLLITLIALGLLSLSTVTIRATDAGSAMATARANARLALMLAIGDIQKNVGPDQRITASADLTGVTTNTKWVGVWNTTSPEGSKENLNLPVVGGYPNGNYYMDKRTTVNSLTGSAWKKTLRRAWLVSGENPDPANTPDPVELVGAGSLGKTPAPADVVKVSRTQINPGSNKAPGGFAYWVGDESQKARIDQATPYGKKQPNPAGLEDGGYYRLAGAEGPNFDKVRAGTASPYAGLADLDTTQREKIMSLDQLQIPIGNLEQPKKNFHDITTHSLSVLADVREGGLKKDLTAYIENPGGIPAVGGIPETGLPADQPIIPGPKYREMGPNFAQLRNWWDLRKNVTGTFANRQATPAFLSGRSAANGGGGTQEGFTVDFLKREQALQPYLTDMYVAYDFSLDPSRGGGRGVRLHLYPRVVLWNPYNVKLTGQRYVVGCSQMPLNAGQNNVLVGGKTLEAIPGDPNSGQMYAGINGERIFYFVTNPVDFEPGECLVFSPDLSASSGTKIGGNSVQYNPNNIAANVLSATVAPGTNNFFFPSGYQVEASVNLASNPQYGTNGGDVNSALAYRRSYFLKRAPTGSGQISYSDVRSQNCATIDAIYPDYNGKTDSIWWERYYFNDNAVQGGSAGFRDYTSNPNRYPPRLWYNQGRKRYLDDYIEQGSFGQAWGKAAANFYQNPVIANFNIRTNFAFRSQFCFYDDWTRCAPSVCMIPWGTPRLGDVQTGPTYDNGKLHSSPFGFMNAWGGVKSYVMFEVPMEGMPLFSLASFQHAQLSYEGWAPTYVVGHSNAEPRADRNSTVNIGYYNASDVWGGNFAKHTPGKWTDLIQNKTSELLAYDMNFSVNQALWDRYYLSSVPYQNGGIKWNPETEPLPNSRMVLQKYSAYPESVVKSYFTNTKTYDYSSYFLMNKGAFNINSTSVEAWRAFFSTLNRVQRPVASGETAVNMFSRLLMPGSAANPNAIETQGAWNGGKTLTDDDIDKLAKRMVEIVKIRGPFLGLADFVNRRLGQGQTSPSFDDDTICGPLQAAIEKAGLNASLQRSGTDETKRDIGGANSGGGMFKPDVNAYYPWKTYGASGYVTQADILQTIGPSLTARGDTFVVRAYGDAKDAQGKVIARAWCEAVVQRTPDYLSAKPISENSDSGANNPLEPVNRRDANGLNLVLNDKLVATNRTFGRRLVVSDFRWLSQSEI